MRPGTSSILTASINSSDSISATSSTPSSLPDLIELNDPKIEPFFPIFHHMRISMEINIV